MAKRIKQYLDYIEEILKREDLDFIDEQRKHLIQINRFDHGRREYLNRKEVKRRNIIAERPFFRKTEYVFNEFPSRTHRREERPNEQSQHQHRIKYQNGKQNNFHGINGLFYAIAAFRPVNFF